MLIGSLLNESPIPVVEFSLPRPSGEKRNPGRNPQGGVSWTLSGDLWVSLSRFGTRNRVYGCVIGVKSMHTL